MFTSIWWWRCCLLWNNSVWWPLYCTCHLLLLRYPYWFCWSVDTETWMQTQHSSTMWFITIMYTNSVIFCVVNLVITVNSECKLSVSDTRYESKLCSSKHIADAVSEVSECKPRPVVVELPWPNNTNIHRMTPTHVEVNIRSYFKGKERNNFAMSFTWAGWFIQFNIIWFFRCTNVEEDAKLVKAQQYVFQLWQERGQYQSCLLPVV